MNQEGEKTTTANMNRSRNLWSVEEDNTLRKLVEACEKDKVDWRVIASYLPGRNNKDCRKRWHYRVSASMNMGPWSQGEDELLKMGIHLHSTHWSRVAQVVGTRNGDQCFKRWNDVLDPAIDRSPWTSEEDRMLLLAIGEYGRAWKQIVDAYFPGRTGLDAKNRHRQLTRKRKRDNKTPTKSKQQAKSPSFDSPETVPSTKLTPPSLSSSLSSPSSSVRISVVTTPIELPLNPQDQLTGERSLSAPPCSSSYYWGSPLDGLFSEPALPPTPPYSSRDSISNSNYERSLSQIDDLQNQYESGDMLMNGIPPQYPYYIANPDLPDRTIGFQQHIDFLPESGHNGHNHEHRHEHDQDNNVLDMRTNMIIPSLYQGLPMMAHHLPQDIHHQHHQSYGALDGIVM